MNYDHDKKVPCYGFGAIPYNGDDVSHCFALTWDENKPEVDNIDGILDVYKKTLNQMNFLGPTIISKVIEQSLIKAK